MAGITRTPYRENSQKFFVRGRLRISPMPRAPGPNLRLRNGAAMFLEICCVFEVALAGVYRAQAGRGKGVASLDSTGKKFCRIFLRYGFVAHMCSAPRGPDALR